MQHLYLIRHATPDWNNNKISYYLPPGPDLIPLGEEEAVSLGDFLHRRGIRLLYSSPMERCQQTAKIAAGNDGIVVKILPELTEIIPGEAMSAVQSRLSRVLSELTELPFEPEPLALVSHGGPIGIMLELLGMDESRLTASRIFDHGNPLPPAGVWLASKGDQQTVWDFDLVYPLDIVRPGIQN